MLVAPRTRALFQNHPKFSRFKAPRKSDLKGKAINRN